MLYVSPACQKDLILKCFSLRWANIGLWNSANGLWNLEDGLCNLDCETWRLDCKLAGRTVKLVLSNFNFVLWNCEMRPWNSATGLRNSGGNCETGIAKPWRQIMKLRNSKFQSKFRVSKIRPPSFTIQRLKLLTTHHAALVNIPGQFEVPSGITLLSTFQVNLKFHGGGNFHIILPLWTTRVNLKFHGGWNCLGEL